MSDETAFAAIEALYRLYEEEDRVFAIDSEVEDDMLALVVRSTEALGKPDRRTELRVGKETVEVAVRHETGDGVRPLFFDPEVDDISEVREPILSVQDGGARISRAGSSMWGTLGVSLRSFEISHDGQTCSGNNVIVTCNHVIANNDQGQRGDDVLVQDGSNWTHFADLECFTRVRSRSPLDFAIGTLRSPDPSRFGRIDSLPRVRRARTPRRGRSLKKFGAASGLTSGRNDGPSIFRYNRRAYRCWRVGKDGFACPGDSGSAIMAGDSMVGFLIAGDDTSSCGSARNSYFQSWDSVSLAISGAATAVAIAM